MNLLKPEVVFFIGEEAQTILTGSSIPGRHVDELRRCCQIGCQSMSVRADRVTVLLHSTLLVRRWMSRQAHPPSPDLFLVGPVCGIVGGFDFRETLHAGGVDVGDAVFAACALDIVCDLAIPKRAFEGDELPSLEGPGELREIAPGVDPMPFGAGLVLALVVLPAFLGGKVEGDVALPNYVA